MNRITDLKKGTIIDLKKEFNISKKIRVELNLDCLMDINFFAILFNENNERIDTVYYGNPNKLGVSWINTHNYIKYNKYKETIDIDFSELQSNVKKIALFTNIHSAGRKTFKNINYSTIKLIQDDKELINYNLLKEHNEFNALYCADISINDNELTYTIVEEAVNGSIHDIQKLYNKKI